jgi:hypothetical protein
VADVLALSISFVEKYLLLKGETLSTKEQRNHKRTSSLTDDEDSEIIITDDITDEEFTEFVRYLDDRFLRAVPFIRSGLKASVRAAEFPSLGILAASLEAGVR